MDQISATESVDLLSPSIATASISVFPQQAVTVSAPSAKRLYRIGDHKWVTRDIAALDFLLGIPLQKEADLVRNGWNLLQKQQLSNDSIDGAPHSRSSVLPHQHQQRWWDKWIVSVQTTALHPTASDQLERPTQEEVGMTNRTVRAASKVVHNYAPPGRRLEGDSAFYVMIPVTTKDSTTKQKGVARAAALREWEIQTAHGLGASPNLPNQPPLLDGRIFFSAGCSYPMGVFSILRYEPRKEEAALRRQKLEARGGGGSEYVMPRRDWRGISYRSLLPRTREKDHFNRFLRSNEDVEEDTSTVNSESSNDSDIYVPGLLDDPGMVLGRHRTVMVGDRVTGPIITSTIQFVEPNLLKAELNKQFRERFDGWEPPRAARKYIGARVVDGNYTLIDPGTFENNNNDERSARTSRQGSVASVSTASEGGGGTKEKQIRMPPSLTLSKIRALKNQALKAALKANLEIGTVALACVYLERLCLDCRVDKSNRRLSMAACLLLASKLNEPNIALVDSEELSSIGKSSSIPPAISSSASTPNTNNVMKKVQSLQPTKRSTTMFASLFEFFTEEWSLSLKLLFTAEWGVFAALGFSLLAEPSQIAFHFKQLLKTLGLHPRLYLGDEMYEQWQLSLIYEEDRRKERQRRREMHLQRKEEELINLHLELENDRIRRKNDKDDILIAGSGGMDSRLKVTSPATDFYKPDSSKIEASPGRSKKSGINFLHRLGMRRISSSEALHALSQTEHHQHRISSAFVQKADNTKEIKSSLSHSPSLPSIFSINVNPNPETIVVDMSHDSKRGHSEASSTCSVDESETLGIIV